MLQNFIFHSKLHRVSFPNPNILQHHIKVEISISIHKGKLIIHRLFIRIEPYNKPSEGKFQFQREENHQISIHKEKLIIPRLFIHIESYNKTSEGTFQFQKGGKSSKGGGNNTSGYGGSSHGSGSAKKKSKTMVTNGACTC